MSGKLYIVGTPIGNLEDITFRALRILKEVDLIAAEDTRHTLKLLNHFDIKKSLISCHKFNEYEKAGKLLELLNEGKDIALVSDAGMPGISDPGSILIAQAIDSQIEVIPIPGPSALITALVASGLSTDSFMFVGFLPRKSREIQDTLRKISGFDGTLIFYEAPHRIMATIKKLYEVLGNRRAVLARELTKIHEEFIRTDLESLLLNNNEEKLIGEMVIMVAGNSGEVSTESEEPEFDLAKAFAEIKKDGSSLKEELKKIAKKTDKTPKELYRLYLEQKNQK